METTINKKAILKLKETIKERAEKQKFYKDQRKTVHNKLPREMDPSEATWKHVSNREILRVMYGAYAIMKGKDLSEVDSLNFDKYWPFEDSKKQSFLNKVERMKDTFEREGEVSHD